MNKKIKCGDTLICTSRKTEIPELKIYIDSIDGDLITDSFDEKYSKIRLGKIYDKFVVIKG
jgi:hypothetical protein